LQHPIARLAVILPFYNPPPGWPEALSEKIDQIRPHLASIAGEATFAIVNDGSARNMDTAHLDRLQQLQPDVQIAGYAVNRGKGFALRHGVGAVEADYYIVTDADFPYTLESVCAIARHLIDVGGIAAGNRDLAYYANVPPFRRWLSRSLRFMLKYLLRLQVTDSQCGLKGFDRAGKAVFLKTTIDRFLFDLEFLLIAAHDRVPVRPVPVTLRPGVVFSKVGWRILLTEGRNFWRLFLKYRLA
jgi:glycosyltransferase involved in cell wall biosynthesis